VKVDTRVLMEGARQPSTLVEFANLGSMCASADTLVLTEDALFLQFKLAELVVQESTIAWMGSIVSMTYASLLVGIRTGHIALWTALPALALVAAGLHNLGMCFTHLSTHAAASRL